ncbi:pupal cuticle protein C1B-like [Teleopsis dalmanni]|uniref:pupal cuticle protein C1B-like n=1 Tax=Teleopsis dalmanni TaxID=139649 RepID=UPI0018CD47E6|nr:pupal cuticle protein C1B-like [Teleopsis dalmanni]XP_037933111.1 pupal cuticle protein C1B-like [Teleopsis dalmanni]
MAFKFVLISALLAVASAGVLSPVAYHTAPVVAKIANPAVDAVASTHQNVVRSFGGTISQYSKAIDTPYSSVRKEDTRISNNVYTPAIAKTVSYAAPAPSAAVYTHATPVVSKTVYAAPAPTVYTHHHEAAPTVYAHQEPVHAVYSHQEAAPAVYTHHEVAPTAAVYTHAAPAVTKTVAYAPAPAAHVYQHHDIPATATTTYNHGPAATTYSHNAPGVAAYGSSQTVHYSPAEMVSHMSFDGFGTHWGF